MRLWINRTYAIFARLKRFKHIEESTQLSPKDISTVQKRL